MIQNNHPTDPASGKPQEKKERREIHLNDDSNNQYVKTSDGNVQYLNAEIVDLQRSDEPEKKSSGRAEKERTQRPDSDDII